MSSSSSGSADAVLTLYDIAKAVAPALIAFVGVIVGVLTTATTTWLRDRRAERTDGSVAARLVLLDVQMAGSTIDAIIAFQWGPTSGLPTVESWSTYAASLARNLSREDWGTVAGAITLLQRMSAMLDAERKRPNANTVSLSVENIKRLRHALNAAEAALKRLSG